MSVAIVAGVPCAFLGQVGEAAVDPLDEIVGKNCPGCADWYNDTCFNYFTRCLCRGNVPPIGDCQGTHLWSSGMAGEWESWSAQATFDEGATTKPHKSNVDCYFEYQCVNGALADDHRCSGTDCIEDQLSMGKQCRDCNAAEDPVVTDYPDDYCQDCPPE